MAMALYCVNNNPRLAISATKSLRSIFRSSTRFNSTINADEIVTKSPYEELKVEIDIKSTKDNPMKVNAYGDHRTIACVCDDMRFMTLKKGPPTKCRCGYWFQLVDANKFWESEPSLK